MKRFDTILETDRLILRPFTIEDAEPAYLMNLDPQISRFTHDGGVKTRAQMRKIISEDVLGDYARHGYGRFAVESKEALTFIGFSGLKYLPDEDRVDLGYRIRADLWGQGFATESATAALEFGRNQLNLAHVVASVLPDNLASRRVLEKLGFGFLRELTEGEVLIQEYGLDL